MVPLDKAMATFYKLSEVTMSHCLYLQRFGRNFECNVAPSSRHRIVSYC